MSYQGVMGIQFGNVGATNWAQLIQSAKDSGHVMDMIIIVSLYLAEMVAGVASIDATNLQQVAGASADFQTAYNGLNSYLTWAQAQGSNSIQVTDAILSNANTTPSLANLNTFLKQYGYNPPTVTITAALNAALVKLGTDDNLVSSGTVSSVNTKFTTDFGNIITGIGSSDTTKTPTTISALQSAMGNITDDANNASSVNGTKTAALQSVMQTLSTYYTLTSTFNSYIKSVDSSLTSSTGA